MSQSWRFRFSLARSIEAISAVLAADAATGTLIPVLGPVQEYDGPTPIHRSHQSQRKGRVLLMAELTNTQQTTVRFRVKNRRGGPARFDGIPAWTTDNSDVLYLEPAADGMSCRVIALGPLGEASLTMQADADLGAGTEMIVGTLDFTVTAGKATVIELQADPAEEQPDEVLGPPPDATAPPEPEVEIGEIE